MPSDIDLLIQETIELRQRDGSVTKMPAHRFGDFATHKPLAHQADFFRSEWRFSHLPTGRVVAHGFRVFEGAIAAMIETARLRNDWAVIDDSSMTEELRDKCIAIANKHGGTVGSRYDNLDRRPTYNGYSPEA